jgi:hypothetical protein
MRPRPLGSRSIRALDRVLTRPKARSIRHRKPDLATVPLGLRYRLPRTVEIRTREHRPRLDIRISKRMLIWRTPVDGADDDIDPSADLPEFPCRVADGAAGGDDVFHQGDRDPRCGSRQ